nr:hypothetical protein [Tanacetum cinerariifolium]
MLLSCRLPNFHAANSLKFIKLSYFYYDVRLLEPLIVSSKNLKRLELINCNGNWDRSLEMIPNNSFLVEVHLDNVNVTDVGVSSLSKCRDLIALHIDRSTCTDVGLIRVAENLIATNCRKLIRLEVHRCETITEAEMMCIAEKCVALRILCIDDEVYVYEASTEPEPVSTSSSSTGNGGRTSMINEGS